MTILKQRNVRRHRKLVGSSFDRMSNGPAESDDEGGAAKEPSRVRERVYNWRECNDGRPVEGSSKPWQWSSRAPDFNSGSTRLDWRLTFTSFPNGKRSASTWSSVVSAQISRRWTASSVLIHSASPPEPPWRCATLPYELQKWASF